MTTLKKLENETFYEWVKRTQNPVQFHEDFDRVWDIVDFVKESFPNDKDAEAFLKILKENENDEIFSYIVAGHVEDYDIENTWGTWENQVDIDDILTINAYVDVIYLVAEHEFTLFECAFDEDDVSWLKHARSSATPKSMFYNPY